MKVGNLNDDHPMFSHFQPQKPEISWHFQTGFFTKSHPFPGPAPQQSSATAPGPGGVRKPRAAVIEEGDLTAVGCGFVESMG